MRPNPVQATAVEIMLDVHVIVSPFTRKEWVEQCLASVREAIAVAGFPVQLHLPPYVPGHVGQARAGGYTMGDFPYVAHVDDDDYVLPHAFLQMREALESGVSAVCTPEITLQNGRFRPGLARHHLIAYRRDTLIDHSAWICCGDFVQVHSIGSDAVDLEKPAYIYRVYGESKGRNLLRNNATELEKARAKYSA